MKVILKLSLLTILIVSISACGTTAVNNSQAQTDTVPVVPTEIIEPQKDEVTEPTDEDIFLFGLNDVEISFTSVPKTTTVNRAFSSPYILTVLKDGAIAAEYPLTISYPCSKDIDTITFATVDVLTDQNGTYSFTPDKPAFAVSTKISVYPTPINESVANAAKEHTAQADWKVRSSIISKGAVLFIWDYNEKNRPVNNSYDILSEFRTRGMTMVGNAPINETSYIGKPLSTLYKENYEIIEDTYGFLICGTIKFTKPVEACDDGYLCSLTADIQAVNMKNGAKVFDSTFTHEATGLNWNKCVTKCKEELAKEIVDTLIYGL